SHVCMIRGACVGGSLPREKAEAEFAAFKVKLADRGPRLEEGIAILRRLWTEDHVSHDGRFYHFHDLPLEPLVYIPQRTSPASRSLPRSRARRSGSRPTPSPS